MSSPHFTKTKHVLVFCIALDIGSGSGYLTVCMAEMVGPQGHVVGGEPLFVCAILDHDHMTC